MPTPISTDDSGFQREYPSATFLAPTLVAASDGSGTLYALSISHQGPHEPVGIFNLATEQQRSPFKIQYSHRIGPTTAVVVISSKLNSSVEGSKKKGTHPTFEIRAIKINLLSLKPGDTARPMDVIWQRQGADLPTYGQYVESINSHLLLSGSAYADPSTPIPTPYEPSPDEIAPIPRTNENLDEPTTSPPKPPPYSWTQTRDSLTVAIPLPSSTTKDLIHVSFTSKTLTLRVSYHASPSLPIPRYTAKALWDTVDPSSCFWTWDKEAEHSYGLLTLHMEKQHEGTRWMQVFAAPAVPSAQSSSPLTSTDSPTSTQDDNDVEVPETLDPSELWHIRESLEKYTSSLRDGSDMSGLGLGSGVPSLAAGEMDDEVDASVGKPTMLTWVSLSGSTPAWFHPRESVPFQLLATPLPGLKQGLSLVTKNAIDGLVFELDCTPAAAGQAQAEGGTGASPRWTHSSTYSAVAFVLASKRDTRCTYVIPSKGVLAFESGGSGRGANLYLYRPASSPKENWAKQSILRLDDGSGGALLGVGGIIGKAGQILVLCLLERTLAVIAGI